MAWARAVVKPSVGLSLIFSFSEVSGKKNPVGRTLPLQKVCQLSQQREAGRGEK